MLPRPSQTSDVEPLLSCLADDPGLRELVALYAQEMPERIQTLENSYAARDWRGLARHAHQLKGGAGSHGYHQLTEFAAALEDAAREARDAAAIQSALEALLALCRHVR